MVNCLVKKCSNRSGKKVGEKISFYAIPKVITNQCQRTKALSQQRRSAWLKIIKRSDLLEHSGRNLNRICSQHFITGVPASLMDVNSPDWVPSLNLGDEKSINVKCKLLSSVKRHQRAQERSRQKLISACRSMAVKDSPVEIILENLSKSQYEAVSTDTGNEVMPVEKDLEMLSSSSEDYFLPRVRSPTPTTTTNEKLSVNFNAPTWAKHCINVREISTQTDIGINICETTSHTDGAASLGNPPFISKMHSSCQSDLTFSRIAILEEECLRMKNQVDELEEKLKISLINLNNAKLLEKPPPVSKLDSSCQSDLTFSTIYSLEQECLRLQSQVYELQDKLKENTMNENLTWSNYKHHNTVKFLIGRAPQGVITFISKAWGGRVSDKHITDNCGILEKLLPGDLVLADRGFTIETSVGFYCARLAIPAFTKGKKQLSAQEVMTTRKIANVRIHVERAIGLTRNKYTILKSVLPVDFMIKNGNDIPKVDKLVTVCYALVNSCDSVVPFE